jgi:hypothetical protein
MNADCSASLSLTTCTSFVMYGIEVNMLLSKKKRKEKQGANFSKQCHYYAYLLYQYPAYTPH